MADDAFWIPEFGVRENKPIATYKCKKDQDLSSLVQAVSKTQDGNVLQQYLRGDGSINWGLLNDDIEERSFCDILDLLLLKAIVGDSPGMDMEYACQQLTKAMTAV